MQANLLRWPAECLDRRGQRRTIKTWAANTAFSSYFTERTWVCKLRVACNISTPFKEFGSKVTFMKLQFRDEWSEKLNFSCEFLNIKMLYIYPLNKTCNKPGIHSLVFSHNSHSPTETLISRFIVSKVLESFCHNYTHHSCGHGYI